MTAFREKNKVAVLCDGQFGSTGKGLLAAYFALREDRFDICVSNASANAGHTAIVGDQKLVTYHLPMIGVIQQKFTESGGPDMYLPAGAIIDPAVLVKECVDLGIDRDRLYIDPYAAVITPKHKEYEKSSGSQNEKIASTQKGVGAALADKVRRTSKLAKDCKGLTDHFNIGRVLLNSYIVEGAAVSLEIPQGYSLGLNNGFYPYTTSRQCTVAQGLSDSGISPKLLGKVAMSLRTFPIRVGAVPDVADSHSGDWYHDQVQLTWDDVGVPPETTTVTGRVRRVASFSVQQCYEAILENQPDFLFLNFMNYLKESEEANLDEIVRGCYASTLYKGPNMLYGYGPKVEDVDVKLRRSLPDIGEPSESQDAVEQPQGENREHRPSHGSEAG